MLVTKEIIPANTYKVRSNKGRILREFTPEYLKKIADTSNNMLAAGLKIPAPFDHNKEAKPQTEEEIAINKTKSSFANAGYWKNFWIATNSKGKPALYGQLDAAGDISDKESPAYKVMNTNQEVSVSINENFEDGLGRTWSDGLVHVAVVNHAVVPDQEPFMQDGVTVVNMSMAAGSDSESVVEELKAVLRKLKINLPGSTTAETFMRDLLIAANQLPDASNDQIEPVPIYMSIGDNDMALSEAQAKALVDTKAVNPVTSKPFTMEDLGFKPVVPKDNTEILASLAEKDKIIDGLKHLTHAFRNKFITDSKNAIQQRISALINAGVINKDYAEANLIPKVEFQMSITDGQIQSHPLEVTLSALEAIAKPPKHTPGGFPDNAVIEDNLTPSEDLSEDDITKALDAMEKDGLFR